MNQPLGLSVEEHSRAGKTLTRVFRLLSGLRRLVNCRYPIQHSIPAGLDEAIEDVQGIRVAAENAARAEHPDAKIVYLSANNVALDLASVENATASVGDDIEIVD